jgi:hypothetical protein
MKTNQSKLKQILPKAISAFLVFWLSSVLVVVCCGIMTPEVSAAEDIPECHKAHQTEDDKHKISESEPDEADCCVFKPSKTLSPDLQKQQDVKQIVAVTEKIETPKPVHFIKQTYQSPAIYHSAIRNRGSTYLINCNFRC